MPNFFIFDICKSDLWSYNDKQWLQWLQWAFTMTTMEFNVFNNDHNDYNNDYNDYNNGYNDYNNDHNGKLQWLQQWLTTTTTKKTTMITTRFVQSTKLKRQIFVLQSCALSWHCGNRHFCSIWSKLCLWISDFVSCLPFNLCWFSLLFLPNYNV